MIKYFTLAGLLTVVAACDQSADTDSNKTTVTDSSLIEVEDSTTVPAEDSAILKADTITYNKDQLTGRWLQPVPGLDKEVQGFHLKKDGTVRSINTYSLVYEKWELLHDTLLLWNHSEGAHNKDSAGTIDTTIIKALTDSTMILFPTKAVEGYLETYRKEEEKQKGKKEKKKRT